MNKGIVAYEKLRNAVLMRQVFLFFAVGLLVISHLVAYSWGRINGWDKGEQYTEQNIEKALTEAVKEGRTFRMQNIDVKFYPRKDKGVNVVLTRVEKR